MWKWSIKIASQIKKELVRGRRRNEQKNTRMVSQTSQSLQFLGGKNELKLRPIEKWANGLRKTAGIDIRPIEINEKRNRFNQQTDRIY